MFKRVRSLLTRKAEDEEAGIDEETRAELALDDESASELGSSSEADSDDEQSGDESEEDNPQTAITQGAAKRKRGTESAEEDEVAASDAEAGDDDESGSEDEESDLEDIAPMSVDQVFESQIYVPVVGPTKGGEPIKLCVVCPSKFLKNDLAIETHLKSSSHLRRLKRFEVYVETNLKAHERGPAESGGADPRHIMAEVDHKKEMEEQHAKERKDKSKKPMSAKARAKLDALNKKRADKAARRKASREARKAQSLNSEGVKEVDLAKDSKSEVQNEKSKRGKVGHLESVSPSNITKLKATEAATNKLSKADERKALADAVNPSPKKARTKAKRARTMQDAQ